MTQLSDALTTANRENLSYREIWRRADSKGSRVSLSTIAAYMGGKHPDKPNLDVLRTLAEVFGTDLNVLLRAARESELNERFVLPGAADALDRRERQAVLDMVDVILRAKKRRGAAAKLTVEETHPERGDYDLAAYQDGGTWESKARAEADAARGEESQEHPTND